MSKISMVRGFYKKKVLLLMGRLSCKELNRNYQHEADKEN